MAINERITSELLARNRRITEKNRNVNDVQLTVFPEKTIEKSFISHLVDLVRFAIDHDDFRAPLSTPGILPPLAPLLAGLETEGIKF